MNAEAVSVDATKSFVSKEKESSWADQSATKSATTAMMEDDTTTTAVFYVDYTPPSAAKIQPPAKYKLFLIVLVMVYFAVWFSDEAGFVPFLMFHGWLSPDAALFLALCCIVFVLTYATLDLLVAGTTYHNPTTGKIYGLGAWLKAPRKSNYWLCSKKKYSNVFVADVLSGILQILEDGFEMFNVPEEPTPSCQQPPKSFSCSDGECNATLKIEHRIDPHKLNDYKLWLKKIDHLAQRHVHGPIQTQKSQLDNVVEVEEDTDDEQQGNKATITERDVELGQETTTNKEGILHSVFLTFSNIYSLNEWMMSPQRKVLMDELQPLLVVPDVVQIQLDRELPDAFSDLLCRQGQSVPTLPPPKWKVWWMTVLALYLSIQWVDHFLPYYHDQWGMTGRHDRLQALVFNIVTVFCVSYIMNPLLLFVFHPWMKRKENGNLNTSTNNNREPWRTLNDGFQSIWWKAFWTFALYGGCLITWAVKAYT